MAKARMINTRFWDDTYISNLDPIEKLLFLYLLTNPATNICGFYELPLKTVALDTGLDKEMVLKVLERFSNEGKIFYIDGWVCIKNFIKHQNQKSPKVKIGIKTELRLVPKTIMNQAKDRGYRMHTLSHSNPNINSNSNLNTNSNSESEVSAFDEFWKAYPKKELKRKAAMIWKNHKLDSKLPDILAFLAAAKETDRWKKGYVKQPTAFLNGECWNDDLEAYNDTKRGGEFIDFTKK